MLSGLNIIDFFVDTYETDILPAEKLHNIDAESEDADDSDEEDLVRKPGHPRHDRIRYLSHHPKATQKQRVLRSQGH